MDRRTFLAAAVAFAAVPLAAEAQTLVVNSPGDGFLNLRTGPGTQYNIIRKMFNGSSVEVLERSGGWVRVRHQSGAVGWAFRQYLVRPEASGNWRTVYSPGDGYLNLRTGPGTKYQIIMPMYNGERVKVLDRNGNWLKVRHESGTVGWAYRSYLVK